MSGRFVPGMLAINGALVCVLAAMWFGPQGALRHTNWTEPAPKPPSLDDATKSLLQINPAVNAAFAQVLERPVFVAERRPELPKPAAEDQAAAPVPIALDEVVLTGIVTGPKLMALLAQVEGAPRMLKVGDRVGEWSLDRIRGRVASFSHAGQTRELTLKPSYVGDAPAPGAAPAPAAAAAAKNPVTNGKPAAPAAPIKPPPVAPVQAPAQPSAGANKPAAGAPARGRVSFGGGAAPASAKPPATDGK